jgi:hypothetical protein
MQNVMAKDEKVMLTEMLLLRFERKMKSAEKKKGSYASINPHITE